MLDESAPVVQPQIDDRPFRPDGAVLRAFYRSNASVRFIIGPVGSGKTRTMFMAAMRHAREAYPDRRGKRKTRWLVVRNTYPQLEESTQKDWDQAFSEPFDNPETLGKWRGKMPAKWIAKFDDVEAEFIFMAFPDLESIKQAKSMQLTGVIFHEMRYLSQDVVTNLIERTGRYPAKQDIAHNFPEGTPMEDMAPKWYGALGDTNMPDQTHFLTVWAGIQAIPAWVPFEDRAAWIKPEGYEIYRQPPGLLPVYNAAGDLIDYKANPKAENLTWLPGGTKYYLSKKSGKRAYVKSQLCNEPIAERSGEPVHGDYVDERHYRDEEFPPTEEKPIIIGVDLGNCFAAEFMQNHNGCNVFFDELFLKAVSTKQAGQKLKQYIADNYPKHWAMTSADPTRLHPGVIIYCASDGGWKNSHNDDLKSHIQILGGIGIQVFIAPGSSRAANCKAAMDSALTRFPMGRPGLLLGNKATMLRTGLESGYVWATAKVQAGSDTLRDTVVKSDYSHPVEAAQHALLGAGEGVTMFALDTHAGPKDTMNHVDVFNRGNRIDVFSR